MINTMQMYQYIIILQFNLSKVIKSMEEERPEITPFSLKDLKQLKNHLLLSDIFTFNQSVASIKCLSLAYNNTMVCVKTFQNKDYLLHIDQNQQILWMKPLPRVLQEFSMPTSTEVLVLNMRNRQILIFNLREKTVSTKNLELNIRNAEIFVFCATNTVCISGSLSYYRFQNSFLHNHEIASELGGVYPKNGIKKVNTHSKLGWMSEYLPDQELSFTFSCVNSAQTIVLSSIRIALNHSQYIIESAHIICQTIQNHYQVKVLTRSKMESEKQFDKKKKFRYILCEMTQDGIQEDFFLHRGKPTDFSQLEPMLCYGVGELLIMMMSTQKNEDLLMFVNPQSKEILSITEKAKGYLLYSFPQWSNELLVERWNKEDPVRIHLKVIYCALPPLKDIFLHWLLNENDDFDDDLVFDAVDSLVDDL